MNKILKWSLYGLSFGLILAFANFLTVDIPGLSGIGIFIFRISLIVLSLPLGLIMFISPLEEHFLYIFLILNWLLVGSLIGKVLIRKEAGKSNLPLVMTILFAFGLFAFYAVYEIISGIGTL